METGIRKVTLENLLVGQCATESVPSRTLYIWSTSAISNFCTSHQQLSRGGMHVYVFQHISFKDTEYTKCIYYAHIRVKCYACYQK